MAKPHFAFRVRYFAAVLAVAGWVTVPMALAVDLANINVALDPPAASIPAGQSTLANAGLGTEGFFVDSGAVLGEYPVRIGASAANDAAGGVLLAYARETGRQVPNQFGGMETAYATTSTVSDNDPTSVNTRNLGGGLAVAVHRAGEPTASSLYGLHSPIAANVAAAYFPFGQGWLAGTASSSVNDGALDQFVGSPGLALNTNFVVNGVGTNKHRLILPGVVDSRRQGLLFVNHAKNEANYAISEPADDGNGFVVATHDNATNGAATTADPLSFVFIPLGTPNVTMARIHPHSGQDLQPTPMLQSGLPFTIVREGAVENPEFNAGVGGKYRLSIPGHSPASGVLLVSGSTHGRSAGGGSTDNIVTYQADGNDWIILSQDIPPADNAAAGTPGGPLTGVGQFSRERLSYFNFAFMPFNAPPAAPAAIPAPNFTRSRVVGWNGVLTHEAAGQETGGTFASVTQRTAGLTVQGLSENYGDYAFAVDGDFLTTPDGVLFSTIREGLRNNTSTGGFFEYGITSVGLFAPEWAVFTEAASPTQGEHEVNFAAAFFGADSGFTTASNVTVPAGGKLSLSLPGVVNTRTEGVLFAQAGNNEDNYALVSPNADGSAWDIELHDDATTFETDPINYVYLPFASENLIAGRVDEDGTLLASTDPGDFTLTRDAAGTYRLSIPGKSPETGMLLLNGTGETGSIDNVLAYETAGSDFRILGLDMVTTPEQNAGTFVSLQDTEFSFAYIDFNAPPTPPGTGGLTGDYNNDGSVDAADYVVWRKTNINGQQGYDDWRANFGRTAGGGAANQAAVPEPASGALLLFGLATSGVLCVRRSTRRR
jgi:hypothetical protein